MPGSRCTRCDAPVDPLRSRAIVVEGRVASVCGECSALATPAAEPVLLPQSRGPREPEPWRRCRCGRPIGPGTALTTIVGISIELRCGGCEREAIAPARIALEPTPVPPSRPDRRAHRRVAAIAAAVIGLGAAAAAIAGGDEPEVARPALSVSKPSLLSAPPTQRAPTEDPSLAPREPEPADEPALPADDADDIGAAHGDVAEVDDIELGPAEDGDIPELESLADWIHPLPGTSEVIPTSPSRRFGAERPGDRPSECGGGHCGVDLGGPVGAPVVSIRAGVVVRVELRANRRSGRYVRVRHSGGVVTWYMHLDEIAEGLAAGTPVKAGQRLGTLGSTGIHSSRPHLHFSVQAPTEGGTPRYVDPAPLLEAAEVIDPLDVVEALGDLEL